MMRWLVPVALVALAGCDDLQGLSGEAEPLATIQVRTTGDFAAVRDYPDENLRVALVWGRQWFPEVLCFLPPDTPELAAAVAAGCRDVLAFTPRRVAQDVAITPDEVTELSLVQLPGAGVMVGDLTGRVAYGSLVVYDDRDNDETLSLYVHRRLPDGDFGDPDGGGDMMPPDEEDDDIGGPPETRDRVYGASFVTMTEPDRRVAFREGEFYASGFYPRAGCGAPLPGFSIVSAGGFTFEEAVAATLAGELPPQDPATCSETPLESTVVEIPFRPAVEVREVACRQRRHDSQFRFLDPPRESPLEGRAWACTGIPQLGEPDPRTVTVSQLVVASTEDETCKGLSHYTLVGCEESDRLDCDNYVYDLRQHPPDWWPCPTELTP